MPQQPRDFDNIRKSLERIARALNQPVVALFDADELNARTAETLILTQAFDAISDRQARARCLAFITAEAEREARA